MEPLARSLTDAELVVRLRRAAGTWFKDSDLLLLEELIRRFSRENPDNPALRLRRQHHIEPPKKRD